MLILHRSYKLEEILEILNKEEEIDKKTLELICKKDKKIRRKISWWQEQKNNKNT